MFDDKTMANQPQGHLSTTDALILGGAVLGILMGLSMLSFELAVGVGILALVFVVLKVLIT